MEWISINERLPEDNTPVVLFTPHDFFGDLHSCIGNSESIRNCTIAFGRKKAPIFTHWMPLPAAPPVTTHHCGK